MNVPPVPPATVPIATPPNDTVAPANPISPGAAALVADRHRVLGQQARDDQRAAVEIIVLIGEGDVRVEQLRRGVDGVFEKGDGRRQAGERGRVDLRRHVDGDLGRAADAGRRRSRSIVSVRVAVGVSDALA